MCKELFAACGDIDRLAKGLRPVDAGRPIHFHLITIGIEEIDADGIAVADDPEDGNLPLYEEFVKLCTAARLAREKKSAAVLCLLRAPRSAVTRNALDRVPAWS